MAEKSDKLSIWNEMAQLDQKNRRFYDELNEQEKKDISPYVLLRWASCIDTNNDELNRYYLLSTNQQANKHFWSSSLHKKLQWLLLTTVSPGMGKHRHEWIAYNGRQAKNKRSRLLTQLFPEIKTQDAEQLAELIPDAELKQRLEQMGWNDKDIKEAMK
jgi:phosphatidylserine/phosphatidylglycerophosphate/cardiolipin synthase-like enzyme